MRHIDTHTHTERERERERERESERETARHKRGAERGTAHIGRSEHLWKHSSEISAPAGQRAY